MAEPHVDVLSPLSTVSVRTFNSDTQSWPGPQATWPSTTAPDRDLGHNCPEDAAIENSDRVACQRPSWSFPTTCAGSGRSSQEIEVAEADTERKKREPSAAVFPRPAKIVKHMCANEAAHPFESCDHHDHAHVAPDAPQRQANDMPAITDPPVVAMRSPTTDLHDTALPPTEYPGLDADVDPQALEPTPAVKAQQALTPTAHHAGPRNPGQEFIEQENVIATKREALAQPGNTEISPSTPLRDRTQPSSTSSQLTPILQAPPALSPVSHHTGPRTPMPECVDQGNIIATDRGALAKAGHAEFSPSTPLQHRTQASSTTPRSSHAAAKGDGPLPPGPEPQLCPEQQALVELIMSGKNVFYTGSAGCGKSTVLKAFVQRLRDRGLTVRIIAPTGRAALAINGTTTWTFAGWTPDSHKRSLEDLQAAAHGKFVNRRLRETDVLVIDEISMVENLHFERLNEIMKEARRKSQYATSQPAFGGVQVIVTGDFCQLPPVKPFRHCITCGRELVERHTLSGTVYKCSAHGEYRDEDKWAFRSKAWEECDFAHVHLKTIHRQSDATFIRMLQKCRIGERLTPSEIQLLMDHPCQVNNGTKLLATRADVETVNRRQFERLTGLKHSYWCRDTFVPRPQHPHLQWKGMRFQKGPAKQKPLVALDDHRFGQLVELKRGMLVVLLVNLDLEAGLCNGSQGIVCGFEDHDASKLPRPTLNIANNRNAPADSTQRIMMERAQMKEGEVKLFIEGDGASFKRWPVVKFHNGITLVIYAECAISELGDDKPYSLLSRTQIPLAPAWAMTIHKSQSLTLDRVIVDLSKAFEEGQVYVALSRATGLQGLKIEGDSAGLMVGLGGNREVQTFLRQKFGALNGFMLGS